MNFAKVFKDMDGKWFVVVFATFHYKAEWSEVFNAQMFTPDAASGERVIECESEDDALFTLSVYYANQLAEELHTARRLTGIGTEALVNYYKRLDAANAALGIAKE